MFSNFIYFIVVLLIYSTYQPPEETYFDIPETIILFVFFVVLFSVFCFAQFLKVEKAIVSRQFSQLDHRFNAAMTRLSVTAIILFTVDIYVLNLPAIFSDVHLFSTIPTLLAVLFLAIFVFYLSIVWSCAHQAYQHIFDSDISKKSYIVSNIRFAVPILLPWLFLSGISDIIFALPFKYPKEFLSTTQGEIIYFLIFLLLIAVFGPAIIKKFWKCKPLGAGYDRARIENLCERAGLEYADILHWPVMGGKTITAGVMGLVKKFRYILVTESLLRFLSPEEIDAVMAHEIGHVKKKHILFYLIFFTGYMLISYATFDLVIYMILYAEPVFGWINTTGLNQASVTSIFFSLIVICIFFVYFRFIFGYFMRNFERQADCYVYNLFNSSFPLITTLQKIAATSGQPADKPNWHHFSIAERIHYLKKCEQDQIWIKRQDQKIKKSIMVYLVGLFLVGALGFAINFSDAGKRINLNFFERVILSEIEKEPRNADLYNMLGDVYHSKKHYGDAINAYETALYLEPDKPRVLNNLAWLFATCEDKSFRNHSRALTLAKKAAFLDQAPFILDTLAESYYVNGMFDEAVATAQKALEKAKENRGYFREQLEKFRAAE
ncbi:MAG: M48 family metalloprotease [Desulfobacterales bacterium]